MFKKTKEFDPADYLASDESIAAYLNEALETGDAAFIADAIGVIARARGMADVASKSGMSRESLYRSLSATGNPELATVMKVLAAMKLRLAALPVEAA